jgi:hypothetical protein
VLLTAAGAVASGGWLSGRAAQSMSWTMTPLGSVTWKARSPHSSTVSGIVMATPSAQPGQLAFEVVDGKGEDQAGGVLVALVVGQRFQTPAQEDDVHCGVLTRQRREAVGGHRRAEAEVLDEEGAGRGDVLDVQ